MNKVIIMGRFTRDPELKTTASGKSVTSFTLAVDRAVRQPNGKREADFLNFVAWEKTAEFICRNFSKGRSIAVVGSITSRQYTDNSGNNRTVVEIVAKETYFCGGKIDANATLPKAEETTSEQPEDYGFHEYEEEGEDETLPF